MNLQQEQERFYNLKIIILGGFLGSGKTSVLQQMAHFLVEHEANSKANTKFAIVENEIGEVGIDDQVLKSAGFKVSNIFSGCVCCTLKSELIKSVKEIQEKMNPSWVVIEATGVAYPGSIRKALTDNLGLEAYIITIADASRWKRLVNAMQTLVSGQLEDSMTVLINKTDLIEEDTLETVKSSVVSYHASVEIFMISAKQGIPASVFEKIVEHVKEQQDGKQDGHGYDGA